MDTAGVADLAGMDEATLILYQDLHIRHAGDNAKCDDVSHYLGVLLMYLLKTMKISVRRFISVKELAIL